MRKKVCFFTFAFMIMLLLGGCGTRTLDQMYSLPRRSAQNNNLRDAVETAMAGLVYAAPVSGENQEPVQSADLDGDGNEEYLVFAKGENSDSLQILLFKQLEDKKYELWESIACKGTNYEQIQYAAIDDKPGNELIVGTRINDKITKTVSLYSFGTGQTDKIKSIIYQKYTICDLNQDGMYELMVIQNGGAEAGNGTVRLYNYTDGSVVGSAEAKLSASPDQIRRIAVNQLSSGEPAVYVASSGNEETVITDIYALKENAFTNVSLSSEYGTSMQTLRNDFVYAEDIDSDGILELPSLMTMMYNTTEQNMIRWYSMDIDGVETNKCFTFHNFVDGWYIELNSDWTDRFAAERDGSIYTFYMWNNSYGSAVPVFTVYAFSGKDRDTQADAQNRFALYRGEDVVYAAKLESASAIYGINESYLESAFHLIRQDWKTAVS